MGCSSSRQNAIHAQGQFFQHWRRAPPGPTAASTGDLFKQFTDQFPRRMRAKPAKEAVGIAALDLGPAGPGFRFVAATTSGTDAFRFAELMIALWRSFAPVSVGKFMPGGGGSAIWAFPTLFASFFSPSLRCQLRTATRRDGGWVFSRQQSQATVCRASRVKQQALEDGQRPVIQSLTMKF